MDINYTFITPVDLFDITAKDVCIDDDDNTITFSLDVDDEDSVEAINELFLPDDEQAWFEIEDCEKGDDIFWGKIVSTVDNGDTIFVEIKLKDLQLH